MVGAILKRLIIIGVSVAVLAFGLVPAEAATKYVASQKTLASFSSSATGDRKSTRLNSSHP